MKLNPVLRCSGVAESRPSGRASDLIRDHPLTPAPLVTLHWFNLTAISVKLRAFAKFENTTDALSAVTAMVEGKLSKNLKDFLSNEISEKEMKKETLIVGDAKLGTNPYAHYIAQALLSDPLFAADEF